VPSSVNELKNICLGNPSNAMSIARGLSIVADLGVRKSYGRRDDAADGTGHHGRALW
jgi:hypothetical protein